MHARTGVFVVLISLTLWLAACQPDASESANPPAPAATPAVAEAEAVAESAIIEPTAECELTAGWDPWEPYHFIAAGDQVQGMDVELARAIAAEAGCTITFEQGAWSDLLAQLRDGDIDMMMGATRLPDREAFALFSDTYREDSFMLYVSATQPGPTEDQTLEDLMNNGFRIGVIQGYYYGEAFTNLQMNPDYDDQIVDASLSEMNFTHLLDGQIDGFLEHPPVATAIKRRRGESDLIAPTTLEMGGGPVQFMFSRQTVDVDVVDRFNAALQTIIDSGEHQRMIDRYME